MEWIVKNAQNVDVERQHLNKILKEIKSEIDKALTDIGSLSGNLSQTVQQLTTTIVKVINNEVPPERLVTSVTLIGDVVGTSVVIPGQNAVTITTELTGTFLQDAPNDNNAYWRKAGQWEAVPYPLYFLNEINGSGYAVWDEVTLSWITRSIESADDSRIVIVDGDGVENNTTIDLATVADSGTGTLQLTSFDAYGRKTGTAPADSDDLPEGSSNLYFTDERAQDSVGNILVDSSEINFTYQDSVPSITAELTDAVRDSLDLADTAVQSVVAGTNISVDNTDPRNPIVSSTGGGGSSFVPYNIPDGQTFSVPINQQALYTMTINLGTGSSIDLDGALLEVN